MLSFVRTSFILGAALLVAAAVASQAQTSAPPGTGQVFKDTSILKPPAGARVAIIEFDDLECPACAAASPVIHGAVEHYKIPYVHYDFPLPQHIWSHDGAVIARYLQDKVSPEVANQFRREVFASQARIGSRDDLDRFTQQFFQKHNIARPFALDPTGKLVAQVNADRDLANKMGLRQTPTLWVVTPRRWVQVTDVSQLYSTIDSALAETNSPSAANSKLRRSPTPRK